MKFRASCQSWFKSGSLLGHKISEALEQLFQAMWPNTNHFQGALLPEAISHSSSLPLPITNELEALFIPIGHHTS